MIYSYLTDFYMISSFGENRRSPFKVLVKCGIGTDMCLSQIKLSAWVKAHTKFNRNPLHSFGNKTCWQTDKLFHRIRCMYFLKITIIAIADLKYNNATTETRHWSSHKCSPSTNPISQTSVWKYIQLLPSLRFHCFKHVFQPNDVYMTCLSARPVHLSLLNFITLIILDELYQSWKSRFVMTKITHSLDINIFPRI
jgi:hypothetical protein